MIQLHKPTTSHKSSTSADSNCDPAGRKQYQLFAQHMGLSENRLNPIVPNGFADHYPYEKWLFHWEN